MRLALASVLLLVTAGCASSAVEPVACDHVVVATWNVRRLFDARCDSARCGDDDAEGLALPEEVDADVARIASAARALEADVVVLEEIENEGLLARVAEAYGPGTEHAMGDSRGAGSIDVGVLARVPILAVRHHASASLVRPDGSRTTPTRDLLEVELAVAPRPITLFAAHLKSKRDDDPGRRFAEADYAGSLVASRARDGRSLVVLAGDFNDVPGSPPLVHLERDFDLFRVTSQLAPSDAYTIAYGGTRELLDHVFVPARDASIVIVGSVRVLRGASTGYGGSDHAAVRATLALPDATAAAASDAGACVSSRIAPRPSDP